jgi:hypothetical protein
MSEQWERGEHPGQAEVHEPIVSDEQLWEHEMSEPPGEDDKPTWREVQLAYATWYYKTLQAWMDYNNTIEFQRSEDFGDAAEAMGTLLTFCPSPRRFEPPITPQEVGIERDL